MQLNILKGTVSQKLSPFVAIHCWKALDFSIVRRPSKIIFIKGPVSKLHTYKVYSVNRTFAFDSARFLPVLSLP